MSDLSDSLIESGGTPQSNCCSGLFAMEIESIADSWQSAIAVDFYVHTPLRILKEKPRFTYIVNSPLQINSGLRTQIFSVVANGGHKN